MLWPFRKPGVMSVAAILVGAVSVTCLPRAQAGVIYSNGFETDDAGWFTVDRVASGTGGVTSAAGGFHAQATDGDYTRWGGYSFSPAGGNLPNVPFQEYYTSIDIYLDVNGGWTNDTRFDFSSAINRYSNGAHLRDFIFNAGFYNDATGPGASTNRFVISASNNSQPGGAFAKNPGRDPIAIGSSGWYTFEHHFYDNAGVLAVDLSIYDANDVLVNRWTLSEPSDVIGSVGGNRYGWFDYSQFTALAIDNSELRTVDAPEPGTLALFGTMLAGLGLVRRRRA